MLVPEATLPVADPPLFPSTEMVPPVWLTYHQSEVEVSINYQRTVPETLSVPPTIDKDELNTQEY
jgi:hypothetical protein